MSRYIGIYIDGQYTQFKDFELIIRAEEMMDVCVLGLGIINSPEQSPMKCFATVNGALQGNTIITQFDFFLI